MAVAQGLVSSPPAEAAATRGRLALAVTDAVMCLLYASMWVFFAVWPATAFGFLVVDGDSPVLHVAGVIALCALISLLICGVAISLLIEGQKASANLRRTAPDMKEDRDDTLVIYLLSALMTFFVFYMVGFMVNLFSPKGSLGERIGLAIMGLALLSMSTFMCLIFIPTTALRFWRMRRSGWRWGSKFEEKPSGGENGIQMGKEPQVLTIC